MEKNNLRNKPIVLSLLFMLILFIVSTAFDGMFSLFKINPNMIFDSLLCAASAVFVGAIYTNVNKEQLSKNQKIKITLYPTLILLFLFLSILIFLLGLWEATPFSLGVRLLFLILPTFLIIISGICIYPALGLGCKIANSDQPKSYRGTVLFDILLIVFFCLIGLFAYKINDPVLEAIKPHYFKYMKSKGYTSKIQPTKVEKMQFKDKTRK